MNSYDSQLTQDLKRLVSNLENPSGADVDRNKPRQTMLGRTHLAEPPTDVKHEPQSMIVNDAPLEHGFLYPGHIQLVTEFSHWHKIHCE